MSKWQFYFEVGNYGWRRQSWGTIIVCADTYREAFDTAFALAYHGWDHVTRLDLVL